MTNTPSAGLAAKGVGLLLGQLGTKAGTAVAGPLGGQIGKMLGGALTGLVLDFLGLAPAKVNETRQQLDEIKKDIDDIKDIVTQTKNIVVWGQATAGFDVFKANISTHQTHFASILKNFSGAAQDAEIRRYVLANKSQIIVLEAQLASLHDHILGAQGLIHGSNLYATLLDTHPDFLKSGSMPEAWEKISAIQRQLAQLQRLAAGVLVTYWTATGDKADAISARDFPATLATRLGQQYLAMMSEIGPLAMFGLGITPARIEFSTFQIGTWDKPPKMPDIGLRKHPAWPKHFWEMNTGFHTPASPELRFSLYPSGTDKKYGQVWRFDLHAGDHDKPFYFPDSNIMAGAPPNFFDGDPNGKKPYNPSKQDMTPARFVISVGKATKSNVDILPGAILESYAVATKKMVKSLMYPQVKGVGLRVFGWPTPLRTPSLLRLPSDRLGDPKMPSRVFGWQHDFASTPKGLGPFQPGYKVRYRIERANLFGATKMPGWLAIYVPPAAPGGKVDPKAWHQDSQGYFDGKSATGPEMFCPAIWLDHDPSNRTQEYRIYRQFQGQAEQLVLSVPARPDGTPWGATPSMPTVADEFPG